VNPKVLGSLDMVNSYFLWK